MKPSFLLKTFLYYSCLATLIVATSCDKKDTKINSDSRCLAPHIAMHDGTIGNDYDFKTVAVEEDCLAIFLQYSGGCETHDFELRWDESVNLSLPPIIQLVLWHNANGDQCEAYLADSLFFDLLPIQQATTNEIIIRLQDFDEQFLYTY